MAETIELQAVGRVSVVPDRRTGDPLLRFTDTAGRGFEVQIPAPALEGLAFSVAALTKARGDQTP